MADNLAIKSSFSWTRFLWAILCGILHGSWVLYATSLIVLLGCHLSFTALGSAYWVLALSLLPTLLIGIYVAWHTYNTNTKQKTLEKLVIKYQGFNPPENQQKTKVYDSRRPIIRLLLSGLWSCITNFLSAYYIAFGWVLPFLTPKLPTHFVIQIAFPSSFHIHWHLYQVLNLQLLAPYITLGIVIAIALLSAATTIYKAHKENKLEKYYDDLHENISIQIDSSEVKARYLGLRYLLSSSLFWEIFVTLCFIMPVLVGTMPTASFVWGFLAIAAVIVICSLCSPYYKQWKKRYEDRPVLIFKLNGEIMDFTSTVNTLRANRLNENKHEENKNDNQVTGTPCLNQQHANDNNGTRIQHTTSK